MDMTAPRIGVCSAVEHARWGPWDREVFMNPTSYVERIWQAGGLAIQLPPDPRAQDDADPYLEGLHGLLLAGGADIEPSFYGAPKDPHTVGTTPLRDAFEIAVTRAAIDRDMPVLGICRGMQLLNVALGGTLIQHLPDSVGHEEHRRFLGSFEKADHPVRIEPASLAARVCGELEHKTYSHHHQGVDELGEGLLATGWATIDSLVEAIEMPDRRFVLGVQWHPEADERSPVVSGLVEATRVSETRG
jgi:putative glutamine amidotransferase